MLKILRRDGSEIREYHRHITILIDFTSENITVNITILINFTSVNITVNITILINFTVTHKELDDIKDFVLAFE